MNKYEVKTKSINQALAAFFAIKTKINWNSVTQPVILCHLSLTWFEIFEWAQKYCTHSLITASVLLRLRGNRNYRMIVVWLPFVNSQTHAPFKSKSVMKFTINKPNATIQVCLFFSESAFKNHELDFFCLDLTWNCVRVSWSQLISQLAKLIQLCLFRPS